MSQLLPPSTSSAEDAKKKRRSVNWDADDQDDDAGMFTSRNSLTEGFEISQWPSADAIAEKRRSSMHANQPSKLTIKLKRCCSKKRKPIIGILEGPFLEIDTGIHPIDYFSSYSGAIQPQSTAIVGWDGKTCYTYEELNCYSDHFALLLKPLVEDQLTQELYDTLEDYEPNVGITMKPDEKSVITILAIWKLGLAYLPLRTETDPQMRISPILHKIKPLVVIGMSEDEELIPIQQDGWRTFTFEYFWNLILKSNKGSLTTVQRTELVIPSLTFAFANAPHLMCSVILHRINSRAEVVPVYVRNATIWNRVHAEWTHFPYQDGENVGMYSSIDSSMFLGQMLTPLLAGKRIISIDIQDFYGMVDRVAQWKIARLITFPQLLVKQ
ncbi:unnamed protein product [Orchesella dallaii]|uniref:Uncharacterized protein n=1 Tax=Orchesella dallaii TaxID=48710 RepID=A0ABP1QKG0_9HEXA